MVKLDRSREVNEKARRYVPLGVSSGYRWVSPHPVYFSRGKGSKIWDVDGNEYTDYLLGMGAIILGHAYPKVTEAVMRQVELGVGNGVDTELVVEVPKKLIDMIPSAEMVNFAVTGTEAVMQAIHMARAFTGRKKILKMEGHYHGRYDYVFISSTGLPLDRAGPEDSPIPVPESMGFIEEDLVKNTFITPFNSVEAAEKVIKEHRDEIAAVILEPVYLNYGPILPEEGYLEALREVTEENDILLIFDEVLCGFRISPGGAQEYYGVIPDLTTLAKALGNGFPISAVAGRRDLMEIMESKAAGVHYGGTYSAHPLSIAACSATLDELKDGRVQRHLNSLGEKLMKGFNEIVEDLHIEAIIQGIGGAFCIYFTDKKVTNFREALRVVKGTSDKALTLYRDLMDKGIYLKPRPAYHHTTSYSHVEEDIDALLKGIEESFRKHPPQGSS